jgi:hypothetical protein
VSARRRLFVHAVARGLALGGLLASLCALIGLPAVPGFVAGLVAAPLAGLEVWGATRERRAGVVLVAWALAFVWPSVTFLQAVYVDALFLLRDPVRAFEEVRTALASFLPSGTSYEQVGLGLPLAVAAAVQAIPVAVRLSGSRPALVLVPPAATFVAIVLLLRGGFWAALVLATLPLLLGMPLMLLYVVTDALVTRVLGPASHLDGAPDG